MLLKTGIVMMSISLVLVVVVTIFVLLGGLASSNDPDADAVPRSATDEDTSDDVLEDAAQDLAK